MGYIFIFTASLVISGSAFASGLFDAPEVVASSEHLLPGFSNEGVTVLPLSSTDLSPAATFSASLTGAFLTPKGIALSVRREISAGAAATPGTERWVTGRRVRLLPSAWSVGSSLISFAPVLGGTAQAVPEPGTFLTGALLMGVCASGSNRRRAKARGI